MIRDLLRGFAPLLRAALRPDQTPPAASFDSLESLESRCMLSAAAAASSLSARLASANSARLAWGGTAHHVQNTQVFCKASGSSAWHTVASVAAPKSSQYATGLKTGRTYNFYVKQTLKGGAVSRSNVASVTTPAPQAAPLPNTNTGGSPVTYSAPIVITQGGTYSGNWQSLDANTAAVMIETSDPVVIENSNVSGRGTLIQATDLPVNLTVRNTTGVGMNPNVAGRQAGRFINALNAVAIDVEHNDLEGTGGIYVENYVGDHTSGETLKVLANVCHNVDGRLSDGNGGYSGTPTDNYVQFFQTNNVQGVRGAEVAWNQITNDPGLSLVEDNINIFKSTGTKDSPFAIHDNYIDGAYALAPSRTTDFTGGGIMVSDVRSAYIAAYNNTVLNTTNYGIAISSGHDNTFYNNRIFSTGTLSDGTPIAAQNVGAYIWNQNGEKTFTNNTGTGNLIGWTGSGGTGTNNSWTPDAAAWTHNTDYAGTVTNDTLAGEKALWQAKLAAAGIAPGVG